MRFFPRRGCMRGETAIIGLPAQGVFHGTLPTSSTEDTFPHGNYGSALVTKASVVKGLTRQLQEGKSTPFKYCASKMYNVPCKTNVPCKPKGKAKKWFEETRKVTESVSHRRRDGLVIKKRTKEVRRKYPVSSESSEDDSNDSSESEDDSKSSESDYEEWLRKQGYSDSDLYC